MLRHRGYNLTQSQEEPDGQNEHETTKTALHWRERNSALQMDN